MVKFNAVAPEDVPNLREGRRGRVSYPILKSFLETGMVLAQLDRTGMTQGLQSLNMCLGQYIRNHDLPVEMFMRSGEIYLARTDLDADGNIVVRDTVPGELPKSIQVTEEAEDYDDLKPITPELSLAMYADKDKS